MKIKYIKIKNVKGIDELEFSLLEKNTGKPCNVLLLVGENGKGKSTVLQAIASCFTMHKPEYGGDILGIGNIRKGFESGHIALDLDLNKGTELSNEEHHVIRQVMVRMPEYNGEDELQKVGNYPGYFGHNSQTQKYDILKLEAAPFPLDIVLFFDAYRIVPGQKLAGPNNVLPEFPYSGSLKPSLARDDFSGRFQDTKQWLINLDYKEAKLYRERKEDISMFSRVIQAFNLLLAPYSFSRISAKSEILFSTSSGEIEVEYISDGMKSIFAILGDMLFRFSLPYMDDDEIDIDEVLNTEAVVLIDEIDCHLHPKWQLNIIPALRSLFPNVQFIMTTHSPLIVKSVNPNEVFKLGGWSDESDQTSNQ